MFAGVASKASTCAAAACGLKSLQRLRHRRCVPAPGRARACRSERKMRACGSTPAGTAPPRAARRPSRMSRTRSRGRKKSRQSPCEIDSDSASPTVSGSVKACSQFLSHFDLARSSSSAVIGSLARRTRPWRSARPGPRPAIWPGASCAPRISEARIGQAHREAEACRRRVASRSVACAGGPTANRRTAVRAVRSPRSPDAARAARGSRPRRSGEPPVRRSVTLRSPSCVGSSV